MSKTLSIPTPKEIRKRAKAHGDASIAILDQQCAAKWDFEAGAMWMRRHILRQLKKR